MARERVAGAAYFRSFAGFARNGGSALYERLALEVAEDPEMLALAALARAEQPQANILFGAVHALLLGGVKHPLAEYYPSCGGARAPDSGDVYAAFKSFALRERSALEAIIAARITNTNEVGRSALLYPVYDRIARESDAPLNIIEIGPSAGLNLNWARYGFRYAGDASAPITRNANAALVLASELRGSGRPELAKELPAIATNIGLELNPVDLDSAAERLWLRALIWPERTDRLARLDAALEIAKRFPPPIKRGNAAGDLAALIEQVKPGAPVIITHTLVTYQFDKAALERFESILFQASAGRAIYEVGVEWDGSSYPISLGRHRAGRVEQETLARCDPHGGWIEWLA